MENVKNLVTISEEVMGMLIRVGMRPYDRASGKEVREEEWGLGDNSLEGEEGVKEVNELLFELIKDLESIQGIDPSNTFNRYTDTSWEEEHVKHLYVYYFGDTMDLHLRQFIKELWLISEKIMQNKVKVIEFNEIIEKIRLKVRETEEHLKSLGVREIKDCLIELKNNLKILIDNLNKFKRDDEIEKLVNDQEKCYDRFKKISERYYSDISIEQRKSKKEEFDQVYYDELKRAKNSYIEKFKELKEAGSGMNFKNLFLEIKPLILKIHKKEYNFNIVSLFKSDEAFEETIGAEILREIYSLLIKLGASKDYIFKVAKELDKLGFNSGDWGNFLERYVSDSDKRLLEFIDEKIKIKNIPPEEMGKLIAGDLHAFQRLMNKSKEISDAVTGIQLIEIDGDFSNLVNELKSNREQGKWRESPILVQKEINESNLKKIKDENLKKTLINFITNDFESFILLDFLQKFTGEWAEDEVNFLNFYHENISPINLNLLRSGKLNKYASFVRLIQQDDILKSFGKMTDEKFYSLLSRFKLIDQILHNNGISEGDYKKYKELIISMLNSKWDLNQDMVNKLINIGLNQQIDKKMNDPGKYKILAGIAAHIGLNLDSFRNDLIEIRQILVNGQPIPMSMREKIYKVDNDLNNLLNGELILKYGDKAEVKTPELFELNYDIGDGLRFQVLPYKSIEHFYVGAATNCCQRAGGPGQSSMIDSFINKSAGVVVLKKGKEILSQSYFHYVNKPDGKGYILDNVEWNERLVKKYGIDLDNLYANLAMKVKQDTGIDYFKCGIVFNKLSNSKFKEDRMDRDPRRFHPAQDQDEIYVDFKVENANLNLLAPKFEPKPVAMKKSASRKIRDIMKIAGRFYEMVRGFG